MNDVKKLNKESPNFRELKMGRRLKQMELAINELREDHAAFKAVVDELKNWAQTLATKLNADAGVTDVDYDDTITNSAPASITATAVDPFSGDVND